MKMPLSILLACALLKIGVTRGGESGEPKLPLKLEPIALVGDARLRHASDVTHIEPLSDGRRALATSRDGSARLWDLQTGKRVAALPACRGRRCLERETVAG